MTDAVWLDALQCERLRGGSVKVCACRLPGGGWLECPPEARRMVPDAPVAIASPRLSGDCCQDCGSFAMVRTGTCLTCMACGTSSGGCS